VFEITVGMSCHSALLFAKQISKTKRCQGFTRRKDSRQDRYKDNGQVIHSEMKKTSNLLLVDTQSSHLYYRVFKEESLKEKILSLF